MHPNLYLILLVFALALRVTSSKNEAESSSDDEDLFVPTDEWQVVKEGQKIPKGLHVRVNFKTRLVEAKLFDDNEKTSAVAEIPSTNGDDAGNTNPDGGGHYLKLPDEIKEALKNMKNDPPNLAKGEKNKFRSYDELRKDLGELNLTPKTDAEILAELVTRHGRIIKDPGETEQILTILEDLEFLVHQFDNAIEFTNLNGFKEVIFVNLNSSNIQIRQEALKLLGSSMQNNAKVQIHALEAGSIGILLRILVLDSDYGVKNRAIFALSSLMRRFPVAQLKFIENAGVNVFLQELEQTKNVKIRLKIVTLVNDLIVEHTYVVEDLSNVNRTEKLEQYEKVNLKEKFVEHGWCEHLSNLLGDVVKVDDDDYDGVEKCLSAVLSVLDTCGVEAAADVKAVVFRLQARYNSLVETELADDVSYYVHLLDLCRQVTDYFRYKGYKSEL